MEARISKSEVSHKHRFYQTSLQSSNWEQLLVNSIKDFGLYELYEANWDCKSDNLMGIKEENTLIIKEEDTTSSGGVVVSHLNTF